MSRYKFFVIATITFLTLLFNQKIYSQAKIKDSLNKISFDELYSRYTKNIYDTIKSSAYAKKYLELAKISKDKYDLACGYSMMAGRREYNLGIKYLDTMLSVSKDYDKSIVTYSYLRIGEFNTNNRRLKDALKYYLLAYKNIDSKDDPYLKDVKYGIAIVKSIMRKCNEVLPFFIEYEKELQNSKDINRYISIVYALSNNYFRLNNIKNAEYYTNKGLELTSKQHKNVTHQLFISNRGKNYYKREKYILAIKDLKNALPVIKKANDYANYAENCYFIGNSYIKLNDKQKALVYFNQIDSIFNPNYALEISKG
jgi:tetratricopeptide (TPR) repeat protein